MKDIPSQVCSGDGFALAVLRSAILTKILQVMCALGTGFLRHSSKRCHQVQDIASQVCSGDGFALSVLRSAILRKISQVMCALGTGFLRQFKLLPS